MDPANLSITTTTRLDVPFWPTSTDNLSWSADNLIAVGGGESIAVLVPRLTTKGPNSLSWDSISLRVSLFTTKEIPFSEPLSSVNWSIGEELSLRHVSKLSWSPPGLARFSTCALAILHSNHVLVLWECIGQPQIRDKWKRCLIVNHTIQAYYGTSITDDLEQRQVRQRIRSFAWVPAVRRRHKSVDPQLDSRLAQREHFLVVSTDAGDIFILSVFSPHDVLAPESINWEASVVFRLPISSERVVYHETYENNPPPVIGATELAFSDWDIENCAKFAYIAYGRLYVCNARYEPSSEIGPRIVLDEAIEYSVSATSELRGPLKFVPGTCRLLLFGPDIVMNIETSRDPSNGPQCHHLDGRWDDVSGLALTADANAPSTLHLVSHLSTASSPTSTLSLSLEDDADGGESHWRDAIYESKANFSASYDLGANVQERTWGIASSPLGDIVATCVSLLPSDSPAHIIQSAQTSVVAITSDLKSTDVPFPSNGGRSPPEDISAETLLHGLRQFIVRGGQVDGDEQVKEATKQHVVNTLGLSLPITVPQLPWSEDEDRHFEMASEDFHTCLANIKARLYYEDDMLSQRLDRLLNTVMQRQPKLQLTRNQYRHITTAVLDLPFELCEISPLSRKIGGAYTAVKARLDNLGSVFDPAMVDDMSFVESCSICHQNVVFESLRWSRCAGDHQFSRCTLTFLSVMEPGISKTCRICNALYLNQDVLPEFRKMNAPRLKLEGSPQPESMDVGASPSLEGQNNVSQKDVSQQSGVEPDISLARLLFSACDICILCGGKFVA